MIFSVSSTNFLLLLSSLVLFDTETVAATLDTFLFASTFTCYEEIAYTKYVMPLTSSCYD